MESNSPYSPFLTQCKESKIYIEKTAKAKEDFEYSSISGQNNLISSNKSKSNLYFYINKFPSTQVLTTFKTIKEQYSNQSPQTKNITNNNKNKKNEESNFFEISNFEEINPNDSQVDLNKNIASFIPEFIEPRKFQRNLYSLSSYHSKLVNKNEYSIRDLDLMQEINPLQKEIWVMKFSPNGHYLAVGGTIGKVIIYRINKYAHLNAEILFNPFPYKTFDFHTSHIIDITWSPHNNNIMSCGIDKNVCIWNIKSKDNKPIQVFQPDEIISCVCFNPISDSIMITGSLKNFIKQWDIKSKTIEYQFKTDEKVTAVKYSPDGLALIAGLVNGKCILFRVTKDNFCFSTFIYCRNRKGKYKNGTKVTGLEFISNTEVLVSCADNRIRIIDLQKFDLIYKFKGHKCESINIRASLSDDKMLIISGSEDGRIVIWNNEYMITKNKGRTNSYAQFRIFPKKEKVNVSCALFASNEICHLISSFMGKYSPPEIVSNIIIASTSTGKIKIFYNFHEIENEFS